MFRSIQTRIVAVFLAAMACIIAIASIIGFQYMRWYEHDLSDKMGHAAANACASVIENMLQDESAFIPGSEKYESNRKTLRSLCQQSSMRYMYAYHCDPEKNEVTYLICVAADDKEDERMARERSYGTVVPNELSSKELRAVAGETVPEALHIDNQYGEMLAWFEKVYTPDDDIIAGADYAVLDQRSRVVEGAIGVLATITIVLLVLMVVELYILRRYIFNPISMISERMRGFSAEHASEFKPLAITSRDEMGKIARSFEGMVANIREYLDDIERMTAERMQADAELDVARHIQLGLVPERASLRQNEVDAFAFTRPARSVGGDFYDIFPVEDGRIAAVVGDASGKGVAAALFMATVKAIIREGLKTGRGPAEVLNTVNDRLSEQNPEGMFVTIFACVLDPPRGEVRYANAGHMPPLVVDDDARTLDIDPGVLLGLFDDVDLEEGAVQLRPGQSLVLYTDGATEAVNDDREFLGENALIGRVASGAPYADSQEVVEAIVSAVDDFVKDREQFDDITVMALTCRKDDAEDLLCELTSFNHVRKALFSLDASDGLKHKACLACEELFANTVMHSGASAIRYDVRLQDDGSVSILLEDDGVEFDPTTARPAEKEFEDLDLGGMGINLVRQLASSLSYRREGNRNILELVIKP